jgi:diadenosine tetraphosphatase ApaH/serine/threonine PP2A family protein phosphatase
MRRVYAEGERSLLYAVLGDIHANAHALRAVVADVEDAGVDGILCVGDIVGYGAFPGECMEIVRELGAITVGGNHDWAVAGRTDITYFNSDARDAVEWTREALSEEQVERLAGMPLTLDLENLTIFHSTLFAPEDFEYMQTLFDVQMSFNRLETRLGFCGHSHVPAMLCEGTPIDCMLVPELELEPERRYIVNVGSVGQPRDLDPRACYVLYDDARETVRLRRVEYDVHAASESILDAGLPITNARRLVLGR